LALSLAIAAISVLVQAEQLTLEEVVVTAQKRVESLYKSYEAHKTCWLLSGYQNGRFIIFTFKLMAFLYKCGQPA